MNSDFLLQQASYLQVNGVALSVAERATLNSSLALLKQNGHFAKVFFWGKVQGIKADYYVAQGYEGPLSGKKSNFYSLDGINWLLLKNLSDDDNTNAGRIRGLFQGDPSFKYSLEDLNPPAPAPAAPAEKPAVADGEEAPAEEAPAEDAEAKKEAPKIPLVDVLEEVRLAYLVSRVDFSGSVVPRGAYILDPNGDAVPNATFSGLDSKSAGKLASFQHLRNAVKLASKSALEREHLIPSIDFLDTLDEDIPRGCWSLQFEPSYSLVVLRSLAWPGYVAYHVPGSSTFGSFYFGNGEENLDLPFML